jgi:hypothetical protein
MPHGAAPGERRGGRARGTPNKKQLTVESALAAALNRIGPGVIDGLKPADFLDLAWKELAKAGLGQAAIAVARDAAPYFTAKLSRGEVSGSDGKPMQIETIRRVIVDPKSADG